MSHLPHPLTLQAFATRSLPLKQGESLNTTEPHRLTHLTKIKSGFIKLEMYKNKVWRYPLPLRDLP